MILQLSTQTMAHRKFWVRPSWSTDVREQNRKYILFLRLGRLDMSLVFLHRIGKFRKEFGF